LLLVKRALTQLNTSILFEGIVKITDIKAVTVFPTMDILLACISCCAFLTYYDASHADLGSVDEIIYMTNRRLVSAKQPLALQWERGSRAALLKGWLQLSCGFCVYFVASSSRMLFSNWT
jgi:hypothetical protein